MPRIAVNCRVRTLFGFVALAACLPLSASDGPPTVEEGRAHWAFQPVNRPAVPAIKIPAHGNPIDAFIAAQQQSAGVRSSTRADKHTLLRRAKFDLLGVPPTPAEIAAFIADDRPDAFERRVEEFLADPRYGETWGRLWLDLVRYAETAGFNADPARPQAYQYRDYVIRAFNNDTPYDRFAAEQLAGDELFPDSNDALIATGYNRMWPDESNASDVLLARQSALNDHTGNLGAVFLGLSIGCAQCHDHKFDPILQTDFYQLQAFFSGITLQDKVPLGDNAALAKYGEELQAWQARTADLRHELHAINRDARAKAGAEKRLKFPKVVLDAVDTAPEDRTPYQLQLVFWSERQIEIKDKDLLAAMGEANAARRDELTKALDEARKSAPKPPRELTAMAVTEVSETAPETFLLATGSYDYPLDETPPDVPEVLRKAGWKGPAIQSPRPGTSGRRSAFVEWLTATDNPLTYRVLVNRIWQGHFGRGLVENANDFGVQTAAPTHPELLDWLTAEFLARGRSIKELHRLIMASATYQQAGFRTDAPGDFAVALKADPDNRTYWHFPRQRLTGERIRDAWLAVADSLNDSMFGAGVRPELPPKFGGAGAWKISENPADRVRRSVYIYAKRNLPYPMLQVFDLPDMHEACGCRTQTTIAPQALMLLNSELVLGAARKLADRINSEHATGDAAGMVESLWLIAYGRPPDSVEQAEALQFLGQQQDQFLALNPSLGEDATAGRKLASGEAWIDLCHAVLNSNEFLFVD